MALALPSRADDLVPLLLLPLALAAGGLLFWPAACLVAIGAAGARRHGAMLAWYGLAVGFDAQALLIAPLFAGVAIGRRISPALLPVAPLSALAMLVVRSIGTTVMLAPVLPQDLPLSVGAPNVWTIAAATPGLAELPLTGLALVTAIGVAAAFIAWCSARPLGRGTLPDAALLCALVVPGSLPAVGCDAFLLAAGLALLLAIARAGRERWLTAALVLLGLALASADPRLAPLGALAMIAATWRQARTVLGHAANDNPLMARTA